MTHSYDHDHPQEIENARSKVGPRKLANDKQIGGDHYAGNTQHWDFAKDLPYLEGCATKYIARHQKKGGAEDLAKALHYIEKIFAERYDLTLVWSFLTSPSREEATGPDSSYTNQDPDLKHTGNINGPW